MEPERASSATRRCRQAFTYCNLNSMLYAQALPGLHGVIPRPSCVYEKAAPTHDSNLHLQLALTDTVAFTPVPPVSQIIMASADLGDYDDTAKYDSLATGLVALLAPAPVGERDTCMSGGQPDAILRGSSGPSMLLGDSRELPLMHGVSRFHNASTERECVGGSRGNEAAHRDSPLTNHCATPGQLPCLHCTSMAGKLPAVWANANVNLKRRCYRSVCGNVAAWASTPNHCLHTSLKVQRLAADGSVG